MKKNIVFNLHALTLKNAESHDGHLNASSYIRKSIALIFGSHSSQISEKLFANSYKLQRRMTT